MSYPVYIVFCYSIYYHREAIVFLQLVLGTRHHYTIQSNPYLCPIYRARIEALNTKSKPRSIIGTKHKESHGSHGRITVIESAIRNLQSAAGAGTVAPSQADAAPTMVEVRTQNQETPTASVPWLIPAKCRFDLCSANKRASPTVIQRWAILRLVPD